MPHTQTLVAYLSLRGALLVLTPRYLDRFEHALLMRVDSSPVDRMIDEELV